jgi:uncharacterized Tic20 family protein
MMSKRPRPGLGPWLTRSQPGGSSGQDPRAREAEARLVMFGYLGAIFTGPLIPLVMYVIGRRRRPSLRFHAAMALNLSLTGLLYEVCCLILCGLLLFDTLSVALVLAIPVGVGIWLSVVKYLVRGIGAANRGERYDVPAWICARMAKG